MTKQEKVIRGLKCCTMCVASQCDECPYQPQHTSCQRVELMRDALELIQTLTNAPVIFCSGWSHYNGTDSCLLTAENSSCTCNGNKRQCDYYNWGSGTTSI